MNILVIDDEKHIRATMSAYLKKLGHTVECAIDGYDALRKIENCRYDVAIIDYKLPGIDGLKLLAHINSGCTNIVPIMFTAYGNMDIILQTLRNGGFDFLHKPVKFNDLNKVLERVTQFIQQRISGHQMQMHMDQNLEGVSRGFFIGECESIQRIRHKISVIVASHCDKIVLRGDTGTGKDVLAHEIHRLAGQDESNFVTVNCPALPETLFESELFGHVRGSFTGATDTRKGLLALAHGGSLYLDEIAELPIASQAKLLSFLESRQFRPIGDNSDVHVNVRIIVATNKPIEYLVKQGLFRKDLYFRLHGATVYLPPLSERPSDIILLTEHFLKLYSPPREDCQFTEDAMKLLQAYNYPGNVRELKNIIERAVMYCSSQRITVQDVRMAIYGDIPENCLGTVIDDDDDDEKARMIKALNDTNWNRKQAADDLDIPYSTFRYKMKKHNIR